ncbi:PepSY domain-containing protein [Roseateles flavus]|uniref:PepSY domain-containing protein n=1 Tax=Roseateles flavus TaxID=3149041 RepID=UPI003D32DC37
MLKERHDGEREGVQRALGILEALHGGKLLGMPGQALALLSGLLPAFLLVTGLLMRRRRTRAGPGH